MFHLPVTSCALGPVLGLPGRRFHHLNSEDLGWSIQRSLLGQKVSDSVPGN